MNITVTFETIAEVKTFAEMITGAAVKEGKSSQNTAVTPVATVQPSFKTETAPVPVQNASAVPVHNSPAAPVQNVSAAPVTPVQGAPTAPVQTAPIHTAPVTQAPAAPVQTVPTSTRTYTPDDLAKAAMQLMDSGRQNDLINLLAQFGVNSVPHLQPNQYGAFAPALREMGAQI